MISWKYCGGGLYRSWGEADLAGMAVGVVSVVLVALPVLASCYLLARVSRRTTRRVWLATDSRPATRAAAVVVAAAMVVALASVWWPGDRYEPIQAGERGTLLDGVNAVAGASAGGGSSASIALTEPRRLTTASAPSATPVSAGSLLAAPSAPADAQSAAPAERMVGATADDARSAAPFAFRPPPPPGAGDNQALVVNTRDHSALLTMAFMLVMVTDGLVDQRNEAYALASCADCLTVAVAFQLILMIGQADVVVPENIAVAVNADCLGCVTYAIAVQLVVALAGPLSDATAAELDLVWAQLAALEADIAEIPPAELQSELAAIQQQILDLLVAADSLAPVAANDAQATVEAQLVAGTGAPAGGSTTVLTTEPSVAGTAVERPAAQITSTPASGPSVDDPSAGRSPEGPATATARTAEDPTGTPAPDAPVPATEVPTGEPSADDLATATEPAEGPAGTRAPDPSISEPVTAPSKPDAPVADELTPTDRGEVPS